MLKKSAFLLWFRKKGFSFSCLIEHSQHSTILYSFLSSMYSKVTKNFSSVCYYRYVMFVLDSKLQCYVYMCAERPTHASCSHVVVVVDFYFTSQGQTGNGAQFYGSEFQKGYGATGRERERER
eukprot:scpid35300/ scgid25925/ 